MLIITFFICIWKLNTRVFSSQNNWTNLELLKNWTPRKSHCLSPMWVQVRSMGTRPSWQYLRNPHPFIILSTLPFGKKYEAHISQRFHTDMELLTKDVTLLWIVLLRCLLLVRSEEGKLCCLIPTTGCLSSQSSYSLFQQNQQAGLINKSIDSSGYVLSLQ